MGVLLQSLLCAEFQKMLLLPAVGLFFTFEGQCLRGMAKTYLVFPNPNQTLLSY